MTTVESYLHREAGQGIATILIVDDLSANREVLVTLLRDQGFRLIEAANGGEGRAAVHAQVQAPA